MDEDKRLAKRRLIESNRARKRAEAAANCLGMNVQQQTNWTNFGLLSNSNYEPSSSSSSSSNVMASVVSNSFQVSPNVILHHSPGATNNNTITTNNNPVLMSAISQPIGSNLVLTNHFHQINPSNLGSIPSTIQQTDRKLLQNQIFPISSSNPNEFQLNVQDVNRIVNWQPMFNSIVRNDDETHPNNDDINLFEYSNQSLIKNIDLDKFSHNFNGSLIKNHCNTNLLPTTTKTTVDQGHLSIINNNHNNSSVLPTIPNIQFANKEAQFQVESKMETNEDCSSNNSKLDIGNMESSTNCNTSNYISDCSWTSEDQNMVDAIFQAYQKMLMPNIRNEVSNCLFNVI